MTLEASKTEDVLKIPFNQIYIPLPEEKKNIRRVLTGIPELAEKIKAVGQTTPMIVSNGGRGKKPYTLRAGFRRGAAFEYLDWGSKEVLVVVRAYGDGDIIGPLADNWSENVDREDVSPVEKGEFIQSLLEGTYAVEEGQIAVPLDKETIAARLHISKEQVNKLARLSRNIDPSIAKKAAKAELSFRQLQALSEIRSEAEDEKVAKKETAQLQGELLQSILDMKEKLQSEGRQRAKRGEGKKRGQKDEDAAPSYVSQGKKIGPVKVKSLHRTIADYKACLEHKLNTRIVKEERIRVETILETLRFLTGDGVKRLDLVTPEDFKALDEAKAEEKAAAKEAARAEREAAKVKEAETE